MKQRFTSGEATHFILENNELDFEDSSWKM